MSLFTFDSINISTNSRDSISDKLMIFMLIDCDYGPYEKTIVTSLADFKLKYGVRYIGGDTEYLDDSGNVVELNYYRDKLPESYLMAIYLLELGYSLELMRVRVPIPSSNSVLDKNIPISVNDDSDNAHASLLLTKYKDIYSYPEYGVTYDNVVTDISTIPKSDLSQCRSFRIKLSDLIEHYEVNNKYRCKKFILLCSIPTVDSYIGTVTYTYLTSLPFRDQVYDDNLKNQPLSLKKLGSYVQLPTESYDNRLDLLKDIERCIAYAGYSVLPMYFNYNSEEEFTHQYIGNDECIVIYSILSVAIFKSLYGSLANNTGNIDQYLNLSKNDIGMSTILNWVFDDIEPISIFKDPQNDYYNRCKLIGDLGIIYIYSKFQSYIDNIQVTIAKSGEIYSDGNVFIDYILNIELIDYEDNSTLYSESYALNHYESTVDWNYTINSQSELVEVNIRSSRDLPIGSWRLGNIPEYVRTASASDYIDTVDNLDGPIDIESSIILDSNIRDINYINKIIESDPDRNKLVFTTIDLSDGVNSSKLLENVAPFSYNKVFMYKGYEYPSYMYSLSKLMSNKSTEGNDSYVNNVYMLKGRANTYDTESSSIIISNELDSNRYGIWIDNPISYMKNRCYPLDDSVCISLTVNRLMKSMRSLTTPELSELNSIMDASIKYAKSIVLSTAVVGIRNYSINERTCKLMLYMISDASVTKGISLNLNINFTK